MFRLNDDEQIGTRGGGKVGTANPQDTQSDPGAALDQLAAWLKRLRAERRISVSALASRAGLSRTTVSKALNGAAVPTEETVIALARALSAAPGPLLALRSEVLPVESRAKRSRQHEAPIALHGATKDEEEFETRYLKYIENRWKKLSIIGLDVRHPEDTSWPLDVAYLSLTLGNSNASLGMEGRGAAMRRTPNRIRIEQALAERRRILVRGLAGCGKTTLLQWLAVSAARRSLPPEVRHLNECVPFLLRLRTLTRIGRLPQPAGFLDAVGCQFAEDQPAGWVDNILASGRGLVLIDGVDEVALEYRNATREWLEELFASYPENHYIVTTRPSAVREGWLSHSSVGELSIHPMSPQDVSTFIDRWHNAAAVNEAEADRSHLFELRESLKDAVRSQRGLTQLATSPLLSALVCALHKDRRGHLPHGRMELYEAALSMLLHRRDRERGIDSDSIRLSERQSIRLLQRLAYWMVDNGQAEISRDDATHHIADALPSLPEVAVQGSAERILNHLVDRSGLLRTPDADSIDFVHRTFQDYLAARFAIERRNFGSLVSHADDDRWEDVIRMAVAHASPIDAQRLLRRLISRGDRHTANIEGRHRLHLLAAACLDYAAELDPDTRQEVRSRAEALIPPKNRAEADSLAKVGPMILDLLPGPEGLKTSEAEAVVQTAGILGGDSSLTLLKQYRRCTKGQVPFYLQSYWGRYDTADYAREILRHIQNLNYLSVSKSEQIEEIRQLKPLKAIDVQGDFTEGQIAALPNLEGIEWLTLSYNSTLKDLRVLGGLSKLRDLTLDICRGLTDVSALNNSSATELSIWKPDYNLLETLPGLANLRRFWINAASRSLRLDDFLPSSEMVDVYLGPMSCKSLKGLSRWVTITDFSIAAHDLVEDVEELAGLPFLNELDVQGSAAATLLRGIPVLENLKSLKITIQEPIDLSSLIGKFPSLREVDVTCTEGIVDVSALRGVEGLSVRVREKR
ncbi:NACHT domain-containing protein [Streptomyces sp. NPDC015661]|uniref:NACHT domain-containing protein n=1 Tax=Streptomyces sp. NPDC015661 TaxID=3364961 RepID=UPI0036F7F458